MGVDATNEPTCAREYFENAKSAQRAIDRRLTALDEMRAREQVRAQRYDRIGGGKGGVSDPMRATVERMDAEDAARAELAQLYSIVDDARAVCSGVRVANPQNREWGDVLELRYCEDMDWRGVANAMVASERQCRAWHNAALNFVDSVGLARAREGMGQATIL